MSILAVEDFLLTHMRTLLGSSVRGVQTLPGDWDDEMTAIYIDDRGLSAGQWKRVPLQPVASPSADVGGTLASVAQGATV